MGHYPRKHDTQSLRRQQLTNTHAHTHARTHTRTHTHLTALFPGLPGWAGTRKVKPIWILLKQETVSGSGISWAICNSAPHSRQPHQHPTTQFYTGRMPFLPSKNWRPTNNTNKKIRNVPYNYITIYNLEICSFYNLELSPSSSLNATSPNPFHHHLKTHYLQQAF